MTACFHQARALECRNVPKAMDSLDLVETVKLIEEIFGTDIPDGDRENFGSPREMVDWLEPHLANQRPNKEAAALLRGLAKARNHPELAEGLDGTGRENRSQPSSAKSFGSRLFGSAESPWHQHDPSTHGISSRSTDAHRPEKVWARPGFSRLSRRRTLLAVIG
jgi:hypothetical protein